MKKVWILSIVSIPNFFNTCHHTTHNISHHTHTICKKAELMSKIYKNGLFKKKSVQKSKNPYFWKIPYKNPYKNGFLKKICTSGNTGCNSINKILFIFLIRLTEHLLQECRRWLFCSRALITCVSITHIMNEIKTPVYFEKKKFYLIPFMRNVCMTPGV